MDAERVAQIFDSLFARAKEVDEFEYACTLLRVRGMEDFGWDPLVETRHLYNDIVSLIEAPLADHARIRLGLLLYSHFTEVDAMYAMLANMVSVTTGERYSFDPFADLYGRRDRPRYEQIPPSAKRVVDKLSALSVEAAFHDVKHVLDWFFNDAVRNAFFHSDYILHGGEFRTREGTLVGEDGVLRRSLPLAAVAALIERAAIVFQVFMDAYESHLRSYDADRKIHGRFGADGGIVPITLTANAERGLYGFRSGHEVGNPAE